MIEDPLALIGDAEVDAVIIASPGFAHAEQLMACLEHGKPVLCEKPLTMDTESSLRVVEAEHKLGRQLIQVGFMRRFDPEYAALKQLLDSGELGRTLLLHNVHRNKSVPATFRSEMIVRDSLVHEVDVARWLFDDEIAGSPCTRRSRPAWSAKACSTRSWRCSRWRAGRWPTWRCS